MPPKIVSDLLDSDANDSFKLENISFNSSGKDKNKNGKESVVISEKPSRRKEINLSELKKALQESLDKKEKSSYEVISEPEKSDIEELHNKKSSNKSDDKKGVINPGQKVKF